MEKKSYFVFANGVNGSYTRFSRIFEGKKLINDEFGSGNDLPTSISKHAAPSVKTAPKGLKEFAFNSAVEDIGCESVKCNIKGNTLTATVKAPTTIAYFAGPTAAFTVTIQL